MWDLVLFTSYNNLPKVPVLSLTINQNAQIARALTSSAFDIYSRFKSWMQPEQQPVDSLNVFNDTLLITIMCVSV